MLPVWIKIDAASDKSLIINSALSLLSRIIWTQTNFLSLWTTLIGYYSAVQLSGKITTFILLICNDVMHPSPGSRWLGNNGIVQLQGWQTTVCAASFSDTLNPTELPMQGERHHKTRTDSTPWMKLAFFGLRSICSHTETAIPTLRGKPCKNTQFPSPSQDSASEYPAFLCV